MEGDLGRSSRQSDDNQENSAGLHKRESKPQPLNNSVAKQELRRRIKDSDAVDSLECPLQTCRRQHHHLQRKGDQSFLEGIEKMVEENRNPNLRTPEELRPVCHTTNNPPLGLRSSFRRWTRRMKPSQMSLNFYGKQKLSIVLCGCDSTLKVSVSKLLRGKKINQRASNDVCVQREERIHGRLIRLVELPVLNQLSEEEVMRQTLSCVSLCDPGVHVFLLIVPTNPLNNDQRAEIQKIQKIFFSRDHFMVLFTTELVVIKRVTNSVESSPESQRLISLCGGQYSVIGLNEPKNSRQIPDLLDYIEDMKIEPYSPQTYMKAQEIRVKHELEEQHKKEISEMENKIKELQGKVQTVGAKGKADEERMKMQNQLREKTEQKNREIEKQKRSEEEKQQRAEFHRKIEEMKRRQKQKHEKEVKDIMKKHQDEARKQAEEFESTERKLKHVLELTEMLKERVN